MLSINAGEWLDIGRICPVNALDRKILAALENDGRLTVTELAEQVGLSLSPCHRRVRALEESGVIRGYRAELDPAALGLDFSSLVFVTLKDSKSVPAFEDAVAQPGIYRIEVVVVRDVSLITGVEGVFVP